MGSEGELAFRKGISDCLPFRYFWVSQHEQHGACRREQASERENSVFGGNFFIYHMNRSGETVFKLAIMMSAKGNRKEETSWWGIIGSNICAW